MAKLNLELSTLGLEKEIEELVYLRSFYALADFGPADGEVKEYINQQIVEQGGVIPEGY